MYKGGKALDIFPAEKLTDIAGAAVDIGTTTVVVYFYSLKSGKRLGVKSALNPQRTYGADVISRIQAGMQDRENIIRMKECITGLIDSMCSEFCKENGINKEVYS